MKMKIATEAENQQQPQEPRDLGLELEELKRRRNMRFDPEGEKTVTEENTQSRRQRRNIDRLRADNDVLRLDLARETKYTVYGKNLAASNELAQLQEQTHILNKKIDLEKRQLEELDKQKQLLDLKLREQRAKMGGVFAAKETNRANSKKIQTLEGRIDMALTRHNEVVAENDRLKAEIDSSRRERNIFDTVYNKVNKDITIYKEQLSDIIEASNLAYEQRDTMSKDMSNLRQLSDREQQQFEAEMQEIEKMLDKDRKMKDVQREGGWNGAAVEDDIPVKNRVVKGTWGSTKDRASHVVSMEMVKVYEDSFSKIQAATGISDIDELVTKFIHAEDQNFSLFSYVNELNGEIEGLEEQVALVKQELDYQREGEGFSADRQRKHVVDGLVEKLNKAEESTTQNEGKIMNALQVLDELKTNVERMFKMIGCRTDDFQDVIGSDGPNELNIMTYLGIIEQRTNEILALYHESLNSKTIESEDADLVPNAMPIFPITSFSSAVSVQGGGGQGTTGTSICILPPTTGDDMDTEEEEPTDDDERPLDRSELKQRTIKGLTKIDGQTPAPVQPPPARTKKHVPEGKVPRGRPSRP